MQYQGIVTCKRRKKSTPFLPKDVIIRILLLLPAKSLHDVMRYVCREWFNILIDPAFVTLHRQMSCAGFLFHHCGKQERVLYLELNVAGDLDLTVLRIPFATKVVDSCNGFVLLHDCTDPEIFHVVNPVTKAKASLPPFVGFKKTFDPELTLSYTSTGHYKVVYVSSEHRTEVRIMVCTVCVDKVWRCIDLGNLEMTKCAMSTLCSYPFFMGGFIYWINDFSHSGFALDVDDETMHQFAAPEGHDEICSHLTYPLNMDSSLGVITHCCKTKKFKVMELIGGKIFKWAEVAELDVVALRIRTRDLCRPRTCKYVIPFYMKNGMIWSVVKVDVSILLSRCDVRKGDIMLYDIGLADDKLNFHQIKFHPHINTLLSLKKY